MVELLPHVIICRVNRGYVVKWIRYMQDEEQEIDADFQGEAIYSDSEIDKLTQDIGEALILCGKPLEKYEEGCDDSSDSVNDALRQRPKD